LRDVIAIQKHDLKAGGRRVNLFEPEASFTRQDFFCYFFVSTDKKVSARAAYDFARFSFFLELHD
jgi:hypothetical protein